MYNVIRPRARPHPRARTLQARKEPTTRLCSLQAPGCVSNMRLLPRCLPFYLQNLLGDISIFPPLALPPLKMIRSWIRRGVEFCELGDVKSVSICVFNIRDLIKRTKIANLTTSQMLNEYPLDSSISLILNCNRWLFRYFLTENYNFVIGLKRKYKGKFNSLSESLL